MARATQSRNGFFGFLTDKKVTYQRDVAKERKERKAEAMADRRERLEVQKLRAQEKEAEAKIAAAQRKIDAAKVSIRAAEKKADKGAIAEAQFDAMKARMEREIEAQKQHQAAARAKMNPRGKGRRNPSLRFRTKEEAERAAKKLKAAGFTGDLQKSPSTGWWFLFTDADWPTLDKLVPPKSKNKSAAASKARAGKKNARPKKKANPAEDAAALYKSFHGKAPSKVTRIVEPMHVHKHLAEIGDLVRLVIDTPTGLVSVLDFNLTDPKKIVHLASSEKDPKTGEKVGKQLYLRGGDQEVNLKGLKMDSPLWIRDLMELGRLHEFRRGERLIMDARGALRTAEPGEKARADEQEIKGSITYRTRKGFDKFELIDYWHKAGEETEKKYGPAARSLVLYDYRNKKIQFAGGQYAVRPEGIVN